MKSLARLEAEKVVLRQRVIVLSRKSPRVLLRNIDRLILVWMYRLFPSILNAIHRSQAGNDDPVIRGKGCPYHRR